MAQRVTVTLWHTLRYQLSVCIQERLHKIWRETSGDQISKTLLARAIVEKYNKNDKNGIPFCRKHQVNL